MRLRYCALVAMFVATPAIAQDRDYCPARPGLGDTSCTIAPGRVSVEIGVADWARDKSGGDLTDTMTIADTLIRAGIGEATEIDLGWTPYVHARVRGAGGTVTHADGVGDVTVALRQNLSHPDGSGFSITLEPFATLPVGTGPGGAGDWSAGVVIPASFDLHHGLSLQSTTRIAAETDSDGHGRHFAMGEVMGLSIALSDAVSATAELQVVRDEDPAGATTQDYAGLSLAWGVSDDLQLDMGAVAGLNRAAGDVELYTGVSRRF